MKRPTLNFRQAWTLVALLVLAFGMAIGFQSNRPLHHYDEFLTLERTVRVVKSGDWHFIQSNAKVSMRKPPLHYFLGSILVKLGLSPVAALMFCSLGFGLLVVLMTALLANLLEPRYPIVPVLAVVLISASGFLVELSSMKLLDTGYSFFLISSIYCLFRADDDPRWWLVWGLAAGLGAIQKAPMALFASVFLFLLLNALRRRNLLAGTSHPKLRLGLLLAVVPPLLWSILQLIIEPVQFRRHYLSELLLRNTKGIGVSWADRSFVNLDWLGWLVDDSLSLWLIVAASVVVAARRGLLRSEPRIVGLLSFSLFILSVFTFGGGPFHSRYLITVIPLMVAVTAALLAKVILRKRLSILVVSLVLASSIGIYGELPFLKVGSWNQSLQTASSKYGELVRPDLIPVVIDVGFQSALVSSQALIEQPIRFLGDSTTSLAPGRYIGLTNVRQFSRLQKRVRVIPDSLVKVGEYRILEFEVDGTN